MLHEVDFQKCNLHFVGNISDFLIEDNRLNLIEGISKSNIKSLNGNMIVFPMDSGDELYRVVCSDKCYCYEGDDKEFVNISLNAIPRNSKIYIKEFENGKWGKLRESNLNEIYGLYKKQQEFLSKYKQNENQEEVVVSTDIDLSVE